MKKAVIVRNPSYIGIRRAPLIHISRRGGCLAQNKKPLDLPQAASTGGYWLRVFSFSLVGANRVFRSFFHHMAAQRLANYLKTYRKRSGLTQREVAFLLGWKRGEQFSRYETRERVPTLVVALACEAVFKVPVAELFAGTYDPIVRQIGELVETLTVELQKRNDPPGKEARRTTRKLSWLTANHGRQSSSQ